MAKKAIYDLSAIESKRARNGRYALRCESCGKWVRVLLTKDGRTWTCRQCHGKG